MCCPPRAWGSGGVNTLLFDFAAWPASVGQKDRGCMLGLWKVLPAEPFATNLTFAAKFTCQASFSTVIGKARALQQPHS